MDELVKVVVDDSQSTDALNRIAAAGARADTSINNLGQTIDKTTQATRSASGAAASNATSVQNQASAFQRLQSTVTGAASSFQRLASTTSGTLGSAFSRLQTVAGNAFSAIIAYANNAGGALNNFNRNLQQNQRSMDNLWRLASATAAANIFGAMWDKATAGISAYIDRMTEVQRTMSMLTVVTPTGQQGEFDYIMKTADKYGVRLQSLANNYAKLAITAREANVPQETMRKLFEGTTIGARVMHMSVSQVDLAFQALTQMMSKGIVSTEELRRQFAERMPGAIHATAKELGVTYDELDKFIKKGKALSDKFIPYLANALINSFGKGIGPAASALDAELNRIHNSFDKFFKQVYDAGGDKGPAAAIRALNEKLNNPEIAKSFARWVDSISKEVTRFIQLITMEDIEKGANTFITVLKAIGDMAIFAAKSVKWLSENLSIVGGLLGAYMGAKIGFMVGGPPGMAVGAAIGGLGGAVGGLAMGGAGTPGTPGTQLQPSKANSQMLLENQLRLQASGSTNGTQFNKADLDLLSGLPQMKTGTLPELLPLKKVGPGTTLDDLLGGATGGTKNGSGAGANAAAAERALEKQEDLMAKLHGLNKNFAEEWDTLNTVFNSAANKKQQFLPLEELISLQQELLEQQPFMKEIRKDEAISLKYQMKELDEYNKVQQNLLDDKKKMAEESMMDAQRMEDEAVAWQYAKDNAVDLATGIQMMAQARAQDNYESALAAGASGETLLALQKELEARNRILNQTKANDIRDTAEEEYRKLAKRQANFWADTFQNADRAGRSIFQSLAQGGDDAFKQVGETIKTSIIDVLYQMTAQKWMISIGTSIFGDGFAAAAARAVGDGGVGGGANTVQTGFSALNGSISSTIGSAFSKFAGSSVGQSLGLSNTTYAAGPMGPVAPGTELTATGQQMSQALGVVGDTLAGYAMGSMARSLISNGYSVSKGMDTFQKVGIAVGSAIGGPIGGAIVGAASGVVNRAFGRKLKDSGIQGTFGGQSGFEGESFEFYKGGWFRSDKTKTNPLDEEVRKTLGDAFGAMRAEVGTFATLLGLETDRLAGFTTSLKISTKGLDDKAAQEKIQEALATVNNELAQQVIGTWTNTTYTASEYAKEGEKAIDTLRRLATSLGTVNAIWDNLGYTVYEASLRGADAASKVVDAFGGLENMTAVTGAYYDSYYTEDEKRTNLARGSANALQSVGLAVNAEDILGASRPIVRGFVEAVLAEFGPSSPQYVAAVQQANAIAGLYAPLGDAMESVANTLSETMKRLQSDTAGLEIELLRAQGNITGANAAQRALDTTGFTEAEVALYDYNTALRAQISTIKGAAETMRTLRSSLIGLESRFAGGGFSRQYRAEDAAGIVSGLLADVGIQKDVNMFAEHLLNATSGEVEAYFREIWDVLETDEARQKLVDVTGVMMDLAQGAGSASEALQKQQDSLQALAQDAANLFSARNTAGNLMDRISGAMGNQGSFGAQRESELWGALGSTHDAEKQVELASQLTDLVLSRQQLEVQNAERMLGFGRSLRDYVDGLKLGSLSPLTNAEKLAEASAQYNEMLGKAQGGDADAQAGLQGIASTYLDLAQTYFAGNEQFSDIFGAVTSSLDALGVSSMSEAQQQLSLDTQSLGELQRLYSITETAYGSLNAQYEAAVGELTAAQDALVLQSDSLDQLKDIAGLLSGLPTEIAARLPAINTEATTLRQPAMLGAQGDNTVLIAELQALRKEVADLRAENRQDAQMVAGATVASASASASQIADATAKAAYTTTVKQGAVLI